MPATEGTQETAEKPATAGMTPTEGMATTAEMAAAPSFQGTKLGQSFGCFASKLVSKDILLTHILTYKQH